MTHKTMSNACADYSQCMDRWSCRCAEQSNHIRRQLDPVMPVCLDNSQSSGCAVALHEQSKCMLDAAHSRQFCHTSMPRPDEPCFDEFRDVYAKCVLAIKPPTDTVLQNLKTQSDILRTQAARDLTHIFKSQMLANENANALALQAP